MIRTITVCAIGLQGRGDLGPGRQPSEFALLQPDLSAHQTVEQVYNSNSFTWHFGTETEKADEHLQVWH